MGFIRATRTCFRECVTFSGRASRSEFWWVAFFLMLVNLILTASQMAFLGPSETHRSVIHTGLGAAFTTQVTRPAGPGGLLYFWISMLLLLALVPILIFIALILQFILWPVVMLTQQSTPGANKYGPNPSEVTS